MSAQGSVEEVALDGESIRLGQFLKFAGILDSGGEVKEAVADGFVSVNGEVDRRRGRQLVVGDVVEFGGRRFRVGA
ncbi:RNA-binding S4 domain-containing protein [Rathayibacter festucae]|uniref:RNA-binding S4 domain-containing protein n=1 Tax=Rathayibacter festucae TaxID=110937 RepID=UPI002A698B08|nr:RNA-binding S4 domain-containing protein [Rathayibacter festucae]MDY0914704.1 RNA-binding S4 domain-containing protein [Rathayibacter festucae]